VTIFGDDFFLVTIFVDRFLASDCVVLGVS